MQNWMTEAIFKDLMRSFVPKDEKYYADLRLHPNDEGFAYYADALYKSIKSEI